MQLAFIAIALSGFAWVLLKERRVDVFALAYVSACVYFLPGFFGYVPDGPRATESLDIDQGTYVAMISVLGALLLATMLFDTVRPRPDEDAIPTGNHLCSHVALCAAVLGLLVTVKLSGSTLFSTDKRQLMDTLSRWHHLWTAGASLAAVFAYLHRQWYILAAAALLLMVDVHIGFRCSAAMTVIAIFLLHFADAGPQQFAFRQRKAGVFLVAAGAFFFVCKTLNNAIREGGYGFFKERLADPALYHDAIMHSEPFTTQLILNEVVRTDFQTGMGYIADGVLNHVVVFGGALGISAVSFNSLYQPALFPEVPQGMGDNIWAQMMAAGGWTGFYSFLVVFVAALWLASRWLSTTNRSARALVALTSGYWAFYVHRNDLYYELLILRRVALVWVGCVVIAGMIAFMARVRGKPHPCEIGANEP